MQTKQLPQLPHLTARNLPPLPPLNRLGVPLTARNFQISKLPVDIIAQRPQTPRSQTPRRLQKLGCSPVQLNPEPDSPCPSSGPEGSAGVAADVLAANTMRERCVAAHDGLVAKRTKRSATKCLRAASADVNESNETRRRQLQILQEQLQLRRNAAPPFAIDHSEKRFESHKNQAASIGRGYRSGSITARGPREFAADSFFLRNLDNTYQGAGWAGPGSNRCTPVPGSTSLDRELQKVCDLVGEKLEKRFQNPRECFRCLNTQKDGFISCSEVQAFFRTFNVPNDTAARIFDHLDTDECGLIEYQEFKDFFEKSINPTARSVEANPMSSSAWYPRPSSQQASSRASSRRPSQASESFTDNVCINPKAAVPELSHWEMQRKLAQAVQIVSDKANLKYPSFRELRQAFRWVDLSKDGKVTRAEVEDFFRVFSVPRETAEYLFILFNAKGCDEIDHCEFVNVFGPAMGIAHQEPSHKKQVELPGERNLEREINEIMRILGDHMLKFSHPREALRSLDLTHDGEITRNELRAFFQRVGVKHDSADRVFELLVRNSGPNYHETCKNQEFMKLFDPVMQPEHYSEGGCAQGF